MPYFPAHRVECILDRLTALCDVVRGADWALPHSVPMGMLITIWADGVSEERDAFITACLNRLNVGLLNEHILLYVGVESSAPDLRQMRALSYRLCYGHGFDWVMDGFGIASLRWRDLRIEATSTAVHRALSDQRSPLVCCSFGNVLGTWAQLLNATPTNKDVIPTLGEISDVFVAVGDAIAAKGRVPGDASESSGASAALSVASAAPPCWVYPEVVRLRTLQDFAHWHLLRPSVLAIRSNITYVLPSVWNFAADYGYFVKYLRPGGGRLQEYARRERDGGG